MWIGTANGLYLLDKETDKHQYIPMPVESSYIYSLYQDPTGLLYIGTNNSGLLIYDPVNKSFQHYHKDNCALISNNIYTILSEDKNDVLLSTEYGLSAFILRRRYSITGLKNRDYSPITLMPTQEHCVRMAMSFSEVLMVP